VCVGAEQRRQAYAPEADDSCRAAQLHLRAIDGGADAGEHGAAEQRADVQRQFGVDFDERPARQHGVFGEAGNAGLVVEQALVRTVQAAVAAEQRAGGAGGKTRLAQRRPALPAGQAMAAIRREHQRHMVAALQTHDAGPELFDDTGRFVAQHHGHHPRPVTVDDGEIRVAQPGSGHFDQHFARAGWVQFDGLDADRPGLRVRLRNLHLVEHGGADFHCLLPKSMVIALLRNIAQLPADSRLAAVKVNATDGAAEAAAPPR